MSLRTRLLLALLGLVAAGMVVAGIATWTSLRGFLLERVDGQLRAARAPVVTLVLAGGLSGSQLPFGPGGAGGDAGNLPPGTFGQLRSGDGTTVLRSVSFTYGQGETPLPVLPSPLPGSAGAGEAEQGSGRLGPSGETIFSADATAGRTGFRVLVWRIPRFDRLLVVAIPLAETQQTLNRLLAVQVVVSLLVLGALAVAAWVIVKRDLRPLEDMAVTADAIAAGDLTRRVQPAAPRTEVGRLGLSLNTMLARIEEAFAERAATEEKLRRFLADASHELRTPLTSIRGYAEVFERGAKDEPEDLELAMRRIEEESKRMGVMVEELLMLARLGEERSPERAPVDLARVVDDGVCDARTAAPERDISWEPPGETIVLGDDLQLRQIVANLLGNALRHTPSFAAIHVRLAADSDAAVLAVADEGPGLEPGVAARVFEPFFRADVSRTRSTGGAGLGLAIVAAIAEAHQGSAMLTSTPGAGATFTVRLPLFPGS